MKLFCENSTDHVPDCDGPVLGAGDHHAVVEAQVEHRLAVVDQRVHHLTRQHVPHADLQRKMRN